MTDTDMVYAALGRKTLELEHLHAEYDRLLALLAGVLAGEIAPQRVRVDLEGRQWALDASTGAITDDAALSGPAQALNGSVKTNAEKA